MTLMNRLTTWGMVGAVWGVVGFSLILGWPIVRLAYRFIEAWELRAQWGVWHWLVLVTFIFFMAYTEGYRGFQKAFSPRCAARVQHLRHNPTLLRVILAPLFVMTFFASTRKRLIVSYAITAMVIVFIVGFRLIPQPWKGILDAGVVVGLTWGLISFLLYLWPALSDKLNINLEVR